MSNLKRAGEQIAALHDLDKRLRQRVLAERRSEKELAELEDEARAHKQRNTRIAPGAVI